MVKQNDYGLIEKLIVRTFSQKSKINSQLKIDLFSLCFKISSIMSLSKNEYRLIKKEDPSDMRKLVEKKSSQNESNFSIFAAGNKKDAEISKQLKDIKADFKENLEKTKKMVRHFSTNKETVCSMNPFIDANLDPEKILELDKFLVDITEENYVDLALNTGDIKSHDELCVEFSNRIYDKLPTYLKEDYKTKEELAKSCQDPDNFSILNFVISSYEMLHTLTDNGKHVNHQFIIWGTTGSGKTTLLKILATAFNSINPTSSEINGLKIDDNKVGTEHVTEPIEFYFGAMKLIVRDVPGTEDFAAVRSHSKIVDQIKNTGDNIDSILYCINVGEGCRPNQTYADVATLQSFAAGFASEGVKIWERVIVCFTKMNKFNIEKPQKPDYNENFDDEETKTYLEDYEEWIEEYQKQIDERILVATSQFKDLWLGLFNFGAYDKIKISKREKDLAFSKIKFIICGNVKKNRNFKNSENPFVKSTIISMPEFEKIKVNKLSDLNIENKDKLNEINEKIINKKFVKWNNWINELFNAIITCSTSDFKIKCANANNKFIKQREVAKDKEVEIIQLQRIDQGFTLNSDARKALGKGAKESMKNVNGSGKGLVELICTGVGAGVGVGIALAAGPLGWFVLVGALAGGGVGYGVGVGVNKIAGNK